MTCYNIKIFGLIKVGGGGFGGGGCSENCIIIKNCYDGTWNNHK